jgi:KDO2-lipid IV(A) lauroyltransferase
MKDRIFYYLFLILNKLSLITPKFLKIYIAKALAFLFYKFHKKYYNVAKANLDFVYPNLTNNQKEQIIKDMFFNLAQNFGSFIENQNATKQRILKKVTFKNEEILLNALKSKKPIVFITGHFSNWEILPLAIAAKYTPLVGIGRALKQPWLDSILKKNREQFGIEMIEKHGAMRSMIKAIKQNKVIGLLVDQNLEGEIVKFFNKDARHSSAAAILAQKFDAIVIPCFIKRVGFERYEATFYEPIVVDKDNKNFIKEHTQKQADITEKIIRQNPSQWLWIHRRWKYKYPQIYKSVKK